MIKLTKSIIRTLERIEQTIEDDARNGVIYPLYSEKRYELYNSTEEYLYKFRRFKWNLISGKNGLLNCKDTKKRANMIKIVDAIWEFYRPFNSTQIANIENDAFFEDDLKPRLIRFLQANPTDKNANCLKYFFMHPCDSSWEQVDEYCKVREFKLMKSKQEYNRILKEEGVQILNSKLEGQNQIQIAFLRISKEEVLEEKGLKYDYKDFANEYAYSLDGEELKAYRLWFDIREKGIYYIYIPNVII